MDTANDTSCNNNNNSHNCNNTTSKSLPPASPGGLGLITGETQKTPNVLESATVKKADPTASSSSSPSSSSSSFSPSSPVTSSALFSLLSPAPSVSSSSSLSLSPGGKKDPGGIGFIDYIGGGVDGLMSCTESLGFESCDERRADDEIIEMMGVASCTALRSTAMSKVIKWRKVGERREAKKFPPPLSSLNPNGQPSFFLRPVRRDGRLELTEVRIDRPEILRASREDGRLRLHLVRSEDQEEDEEEEEEEDIEEEEDEQILMEKTIEEEEEEVNQDVDDEVLKEEERLEEEVREDQWRVAVNGETLRRCHNDVVMAAAAHVHHHHRRHGNHHHNEHHHLHVWSQQCVTTR